MKQLKTLKSALIKDFGYSEESLQDKTREELDQLLETLENTTGKLDVYEIPTSSEHEDIDIMSLFREDEIYEKYPMLFGLRRVATIVFGKLISSTSDIIQAPSPENNYRCTIRHRLVFLGDDGNTIAYDGCADSCENNTTGIFNKFPVAMAETRAQARAYRHVLNLKNPSFEEMTYDNVEDTGNKIMESQIMVIKNQCDRMGLNIDKFLAKQKGITFDSINNLSNADGLDLIEVLKKYRNDEEEVPKEIKL